MARSERFELPTLGIEIRCSIQLSYERKPPYRNCGVPMSRDFASRPSSGSILTADRWMSSDCSDRGSPYAAKLLILLNQCVVKR